MKFIAAGLATAVFSVGFGATAQTGATRITAGAHTLRWSYEKDGSASIGQDAAWIDAVVLP